MDVKQWSILEGVGMNFLPDGLVLLQFVSAVVVISLIPGPDMTLFVGRAIAQGRLAGLACVMGTSSGIVLHVLGVVLGLSALIIAAPDVFFMLKVIGTAYLVWLAWRALTRKSAFDLRMEKTKKKHFWQNYGAGLATNLLNPKIILFNMTFLPQFVAGADPHATGKLIFLGLSFIPISLVITIPMILVADGFARTLKTRPHIMRLLDWLMACLFVGFALRLIFDRDEVYGE